MSDPDFQRGHLVWVDLPDPQDANPKHRPAIIFDIDTNGRFLLLIASTGKFDVDQLAEDEVLLPSGNKQQPSHLGLTKPTVAKCSWFAIVDVSALSDPRGPVSESLRFVIATKASEANRSGKQIIVRDDRNAP